MTCARGLILAGQVVVENVCGWVGDKSYELSRWQQNPRREFWESPDKSKIMSGEDVNNFWRWWIKVWFEFIVMAVNISKELEHPKIDIYWISKGIECFNFSELFWVAKSPSMSSGKILPKSSIFSNYNGHIGFADNFIPIINRPWHILSIYLYLKITFPFFNLFPQRIKCFSNTISNNPF